VSINSYQICQKNIEFYLYIQVPNVTSKMNVGLTLAGPPCMSIFSAIFLIAAFSASWLMYILLETSQRHCSSGHSNI